MPEGHISHAILSLFEQAASFDEFQTFGLYPEVDEEFEDIEDMSASLISTTDPMACSHSVGVGQAFLLRQLLRSWAGVRVEDGALVLKPL